MAKSSSPKKPLKNASPVALAPEPEPIVSAPAKAPSKASSKPKTVLPQATEPVLKSPTVAPASPSVSVITPAPLLVVAEPETDSKKDKKKKDKEKKEEKKEGKKVKIDLAKPLVVKKKKAVTPKTDKELPPPTEAPKGRRILFITAECTPLAQTGGLGDAVAGLSKALLHRGHDVRIVMPLYGRIDRHRYNITFSRTCCIHFGRGEEIWVGIYEGKLDDQVPIWFIDYGRYFDRHEIYSSEEDGYRFGVLCKAALQICKDVDWIPHVAHVHDWMTSVAAVFLKTWDRVLSPLSVTASVLTIHNIGYQGQFDPSVLGFYGFGADYLTADKFEDHGAVNLLKAGIQYADMITTVSPTYAHEIRGPIGGMGMGMFLNDRGTRVSGILNGVDTSVWNPATDRFLPAHFSKDNLAGKAECKRALQERFGLAVDPKVPIFAVISRFAPQKGFDLMRGSLPQALRDMNIQVVALGTGDSFTEHFFRWLAEAYPGRANAHIGFAPEIAHLIEAGSDFFIMPSIYEPCGLNQMYSSLYGTLPIVRATGGLDDTVDNYHEDTGHGTGFKFWEISGRALYFTLGWANATWWDRPHHIQTMQQQGMSKDFTWQASAEKYEQVYEEAIKHRNG